MPETQETWVHSRGREDTLEKETAIHSSVLTWKIPLYKGAWQTGLQSMGSQRVGYNWAHTQWLIMLNIFFHVIHFFSSVTQSCLDSLQPHGLQHTRLPCLSPTLRACSNSCPSGWWYPLTMSSLVVPFCSCLQIFPASGSFKWVSTLHQVSKYWSFNFNLSASNEYSGLISLGWTD